MSPANHPHDTGIGKTARCLARIFPDDAFWVRVQMALPFGLHTDPIPEIAVVEGEITTHHEQPSTALLVVEVADSSLDYDAGDKADLYAAAGIADYWVLDLNGRRLLTFRNPAVDAASLTGFRYAPPSAHDVSAVVSSLAAPHAIVRVADLLP
jgi:Uma2 family endonuclease